MREQRQLKLGAAALVGLGLVIALLFIAAAGGLWAWLLLGAVLAGIAVAALLIYAQRPGHPPRAAAPPPASQPADGVHRILVIADDGCGPTELRDALAFRRTEAPLEVFIVAPALGSRVGRWTGNEGAYAQAQARLDATIAAFAELEIDARGHVGSHDPLQAADDGLREFPASEVVFATTSNDDGGWLEEGVVEEARLRYGIAVTQIGGSA
jgi:hypothetical protein